MFTKNKQPLVSVIMPVYNAGEFLVEAIESIIHQTYKNFEFIIVDDGSTDNSWETIEYHQKKYPRLIKSYRLSKNMNAAGNGAVNAVLSKTRGKYIARMDADDIAHPKRLEKQIEYLNSNPEVIVLGTQARVINQKGSAIGKKIYPLDHENIYKNYAVVHPIIHPSCMVRRSLLPNKNKLYEMRFGVNDDYYTFFKLHNFGKFANLPDFLLDYRIHKGNSSLNNLKEKYKIISEIRSIAKNKFGYKLSLKAKIIIFLQDILVSFIPDDLLKSVYLILRGIHIDEEMPVTFLRKINFAFSRIQQYAFSIL